MRRLMISSLPRRVSKHHPCPFLTSGMGNGQCSCPTSRAIIRSLSDESWCLVSYIRRNCSRAFRSATASPDAMRSLPALPKIASRSVSSPLLSAVASASTAASGDGNTAGPEPLAGNLAETPAAVPTTTRAVIRKTIAMIRPRVCFTLAVFAETITVFSFE